jgi:hypothetical protein
VGLAAAAVGTLAFAVGLHESFGAAGRLLPYRLLYELAPGWQGIRTPGRIYTLTSLALALLAGAGAAGLVGRTRSRAAAAATAASLVVVILLEGWTRIDYPTLPRLPAAQQGLPGPQLHLPTEAQRDALFLFWSTSGFSSLANGYVGFPMASLDRLRREAENFPDARSTAFLRWRGIRVVVLHRDLAAGTPWQDAERRPTAGLSLDLERRNDIVVYRLLTTRGT